MAPSAPWGSTRTPAPESSTFAQDLRESMLLGYGVGNNRAKRQGNSLETG